jgi:uncharacterized protein YjbJ (UPF0337 family)
MSNKDKSKNKVQDITGAVKAKVGAIIGNKHLQARGKAQQAQANLKQGGEKVKDAFSY